MAMRQNAFLRVLKVIGMWLPALMLAVVFALQGLAKFSDSSGWVVAFRGWGYPDWFRMTIGIVEIIAAACMLWSRTAPIGAVLIICVMLGGMATHVGFGQARQVGHEIGPFVLATVVLLIRRRELKALIDRVRGRRSAESPLSTYS